MPSRGRVTQRWGMAIPLVLLCLPGWAHADPYEVRTGSEAWPDILPVESEATSGGFASPLGDLSIGADTRDAAPAGMPLLRVDGPLPGQSVATGYAAVVKRFVLAPGTYDITATFAPIFVSAGTRPEPSLDTATYADVAAELRLRLVCSFIAGCGSIWFDRPGARQELACSRDGFDSCPSPGGIDLRARVTIPRDGFTLEAEARLSGVAGVRGAGAANLSARATVYRIFSDPA